MKRRRRALRVVLGVAVGLAAVLAVLWPASPAHAGTVLRGIDDNVLPTLSPDAQAQHLQEITSQLRAGVLRVDCRGRSPSPRKATTATRATSAAWWPPSRPLMPSVSRSS